MRVSSGDAYLDVIQISPSVLSEEQGRILCTDMEVQSLTQGIAKVTVNEQRLRQAGNMKEGNWNHRHPEHIPRRPTLLYNEVMAISQATYCCNVSLTPGLF